MFVAGTTAYATVRAVGPVAGDTVVVSGAAGGVGTLAVQLAKLAGATVIGLASEVNHEWLADHGVYRGSATATVSPTGSGRSPTDGSTRSSIPSAATTSSSPLELGVAPDRIDTIANFEAVQKYGVKARAMVPRATADVVAELAGLIDTDQLELPIAAVYPLAEVAAAYTELAQGHTRGKIVLVT